MLIRLLAIALLTITVAACSSTKDEAADGVTVGERTDGGPLDGTGVYGDGSVNGSVVPGSQQDLATNVGDRVFFAYDSSDLAPEARDTLNRQVEWLNRYPNLQITIEGHSDERGTREYNIALGDRRATSVKNYLVSMGVPASRLNTISYGKERPAVVGDDAASWAQNRRGVTTVQ
ncbi:MAG: peptidoglycan-associated lipoprotein Pal [Micavibrio aeruginosavorus]|uniref:Peptidoglycan-associated lipoprotein n=1 Tax=Micavibrio aeruginosavorus TaxID=349221 RepID=A0A2W5N520_9BACT|nr:MAG: peptidoglycan-associated lipoprotein Pal [Micavibrio aeruginosavorus]